jgi:hypothetical protein
MPEACECKGVCAATLAIGRRECQRVAIMQTLLKDVLEHLQSQHGAETDVLRIVNAPGLTPAISEDGSAMRRYKLRAVLIERLEQFK